MLTKYIHLELILYGYSISSSAKLDGGRQLGCLTNRAQSQTKPKRNETKRS